MKGEDLRHRQHHHRHHHQHHPSIPAVSTEPFRVSPECSQSVSERPQSAPERPQSVPGISLFRSHVGAMLGSVWGSFLDPKKLQLGGAKDSEAAAPGAPVSGITDRRSEPGNHAPRPGLRDVASNSLKQRIRFIEHRSYTNMLFM